jgi:hypothetical protein
MCLILRLAGPWSIGIGTAPAKEGTPRERAESTSLGRSWDLLVELVVLARRGEAGVILSRGVIVTTARWVREGVVGIIYLLEFLGPCSAVRRVCGDAVGVVF